jgi:HEAT repeat protein
MDAIIAATVALIVVAAGWTVTFLATRVLVARRERVVRAARERMRPVALEIVYEDERPDLSGLDTQELEALSTLVERYGKRLRGDSRTLLAEFFEASGAVERQRDTLRRGRGWKRATAAFSLGDMGAASAVPDLITALDDRDQAVRIAAARSLGAIGATEAVPPLVDSLSSERVPWLMGGHALISIGSASAPALREHAADESSPLRARAIELLGFVGDAGDASALLGALSSESSDLRERAARALGRLGARDAVEALRHALADPVPAVAAAAAASLGAIGDRGAVDALLELARTGRHDPARAAAQAAASLDPRRVDLAANEPGAGDHLGEAADLAAL